MWDSKDQTIVEIGKGLRRRSANITHEPLPQRWVDLIHYLNTDERSGPKHAINQKLSRESDVAHNTICRTM